MKIILSPHFSKELKDILRYIANDKPSASLKFKNELQQKLKVLIEHPYRYRESFYFNDSTFVILFTKNTLLFMK
ncbi:MAG: type II toxin-antitoxin system RelE/ParE family toxin [Campylobacterales bacterium]|nr:type II toxin-antitoxin system RelE/ParE family toxin [Campylobacterales bacterium]